MGQTVAERAGNGNIINKSRDRENSPRKIAIWCPSSTAGAWGAFHSASPGHWSPGHSRNRVPAPCRSRRQGVVSFRS